MSPRYSVVIPVYNVVDDLTECIESIYRQSFTDFELIAVDDNSTDGSSEQLCKIAEVYGFDVILLDETKGPGNARNVGVNHACGDYIVFVDGDDKLDTELFSTLTVSDSELIIYDFARFWPSGDIRYNQTHEHLKKLSGKELSDFEDKIALFSNFQVCWNKAYKREFYLRESMRFELGYYEDISFNYQAILSARSICILPFAGYWYRQREGSILNSKSDNHISIVSQYDKVYDLISNLDCDMIIYNRIMVEMNAIYVNHIFNLVVKQSQRLTSNGRKRVLNGFFEMIKARKLKLKKKTSLIIKYLILRAYYKVGHKAI
ncbi:glycosyltransferase [Photobacterium japonica]|uniref:glycosyltransferase family 2 protein n=1 Tax=Photobacterium japonica TaxID=2910235 RepID=UPI003D0DF6A9